jgi:outer membrane protein assembly factor BamC
MLEADLLARLMVDFGLDSQQAKNELASAATARAQLTKTGLLLTQIDMDMAWRRVGQALDRSRVVIEDLDRSAGIYYVHYIPHNGQKSSGGVFGLFGDSSPDSKDDTSHDRFQVVLKTQADGTNVTVRDVKGDPDSSTSATELLQQLHQQLQ